MTRKRLVFFRSIKLLLKYLILGVGIALVTIWGQDKLSSAELSPVFASTPVAIAQTSSNPLAINAQSLTDRGHEQLALGNAEEALKIWERAMEVYEELGDKEGIIGSRINQSIALQALGQYRRACKTLLPALDMGINHQVCEASTDGNQAIPEQPNTLISAVGLRTFGDVLRGIGKLDKSHEALRQSLKIAQDIKSNADISAVLLSLGNTERASYNQLLESYRRTNSTFDRNNAISKAEQALEYYQQATTYSSSKITLIQAKLNRLSLLVEFQEWLRSKNLNSEVEDWQPKIQFQLADLLQNQSEISNLPPSQTTVYTLLNFAESLSILKKNDIAIQYARYALQQAETLNDKRAKAYALGTLGSLYEQMQNLSQAQQFTEQATGLAQAIQAWDITYQWQRQLGRIYEKQGNIPDAIAAYDVAVNDLERVRKDLLSNNLNVQFYFQDNVEDVYREFLKLLLRPDAKSENLNRASQLIGSLQLAEIENFLQCDYPDLVPIDKANKPPAAVIYPIILTDRIEVIVKLPLLKNLHRYTTPLVSKKEFEETLDQLRGRLPDKQNNVKESILPPAQKLYDWLVRRAAPDLPENGTLVFVPDSTLQSIPMAVLHDGKQYLVEKYSIAVSLGSQLPDAKPLQPGQWKALLAGVSEKPPSFPKNLPALPNVEDELGKIQSAVPSQKLLNQQFTIEALQNKINAAPFPVVHIATHGQFSSDPEQTKIYAWDNSITVKQIDKLLRSRVQTTRDPIELLVLSACETAKGDRRAALGIAGVALRANVRSTVASLWIVNDELTAEFIEQFYQELNKPNMTKAEALRKVQRTFLQQKQLDPYYWAAFILAGSWL